MRAALFTAMLGLSATMVFAAEPEANVKAFLDTHIAPWAQDPAILSAVAKQNAQTAGYDAATIEEMDQKWRAEVGTGASELVDGVLMNPASDLLRSRVEGSGGMMTEVIVMDALGLNVAASQATSDYWQGDEDKYQQTYSVGPRAVHVSEIEFDESSQTYQVQISITLNDPATGAPIGAMTVGIDAEALM
ncbi:hypothetical protein CDO87_20190 [Sagittula sp. P11]|uniref:hypothetical protein n=1 Tax=unclassified Sagittula TaxID=2624628 RepID=UPI000C2D3D2A|nr:hypothetical protein [Sagittula sp. P11]AUC55341.1 hypothetical protein CDO87_20190 [Sagittula sp. P11]